VEKAPGFLELVSRTLVPRSLKTIRWQSTNGYYAKSCNTLASRICLKLHSRTNIDLILLRETSDIKTSDVGVVKTLISDHYALAVALNLDKQQYIVKHTDKITKLDNNI